MPNRPVLRCQSNTQSGVKICLMMTTKPLQTKAAAAHLQQRILKWAFVEGGNFQRSGFSKFHLESWPAHRMEAQWPNAAMRWMKAPKRWRMTHHRLQRECLNVGRNGESLSTATMRRRAQNWIRLQRGKHGTLAWLGSWPIRQALAVPAFFRQRVQGGQVRDASGCGTCLHNSSLVPHSHGPTLAWRRSAAFSSYSTTCTTSSLPTSY
mmetsp:Transcript_56944/g.135456  ORF Transcript_56944/g.135456 Transcript_56944/m.135456 type:complete len:208 (+) Transcript_56944:74-697(+)